MPLTQNEMIAIAVAVLVVLIVLVYWFWYRTPATTTPAANASSFRAVTTRTASQTAQDHPFFDNTTIAQRNSTLAPVVFQHENGYDMPRTSMEEMMGANEEYYELGISGQVDPDSSLMAMDLGNNQPPQPHMSHAHAVTTHQMTVNDHHKNVVALQETAKKSGADPRVMQAVQNVANSSKAVRDSVANMKKSA